MAMERVNLIPDDLVVTWADRALAYVDRRFLPVLLWTVGVLCVAEAGLALNQAARAQRYTRQARALEERRATVTAEQEQMGAYLAQLDRTKQQLGQQVQWLSQRTEYLKGYQAPGVWASLLEDLKQALPYGVWLTNLEGARGTLRLSGGAFSDTLVSQFMGQLKALPNVSDVTFNYTKQSTIGRAGIVEFEIACRWTAPGMAG